MHVVRHEAVRNDFKRIRGSGTQKLTSHRRGVIRVGEEKLPFDRADRQEISVKSPIQICAQTWRPRHSDAAALAQPSFQLMAALKGPPYYRRRFDHIDERHTRSVAVRI